LAAVGFGVGTGVGGAGVGGADVGAASAAFFASRASFSSAAAAFFSSGRMPSASSGFRSSRTFSAGASVGTGMSEADAMIAAAPPGPFRAAAPVFIPKKNDRPRAPRRSRKKKPAWRPVIEI
jgi:hypothetical protein